MRTYAHVKTAYAERSAMNKYVQALLILWAAGMLFACLIKLCEVLQL
jgi:hypothetical protein